MIYLLYSSNRFLLNEAAKSFSSSLKKRSKNKNFSIFSVDFSEDDALNYFEKNLKSNSLFSDNNEVKLFLLSQLENVNGEKTKKIRELIKLCENVENLICIIKSESRTDNPPVKIRQLLKGLNYESKYLKLKGPKAEMEYILKILLSQGVSVGRSVLEAIYENEKGDLFAVYNNAIKWHFYKKGPNVTLNMISDEYVEDATLNEFFRSVVSRYPTSLSRKMDVFERVIMNKDIEYAAIPYFSKATTDIGILKKLVNYDIKIKSGLLEPDLAMLDLVLSVS